MIFFHIMEKQQISEKFVYRNILIFLLFFIILIQFCVIGYQKNQILNGETCLQHVDRTVYKRSVQNERFCPPGCRKITKRPFLTGYPGNIETPPGIRGVMGPPGRGAAGSQGMSGAAGIPGRQGQSGIPGNQGQRGMSGGQGQSGSPGRQGQPGMSGGQGQSGSPGRQGQPGMSGGQGQSGSPGRQGQPGMSGGQGQSGSPGRQGQQGSYSYRNIQEPVGHRSDYVHRGDQRGSFEFSNSDFDESKFETKELKVAKALQTLELYKNPNCVDDINHQNIRERLKEKGTVSFMILVDLAQNLFCIVHN